MHIAFAPASNAGINTHSLVTPPAGFSDIKYVRGVAGQPFVEVFGPGDCCAADSPRAIAQAARGAGAPVLPSTAMASETVAGTSKLPAGGLTVEGLPIMKPPYGVLAAIQLDRGELLWQVPHGDTPDGVRNHPALKGHDDSEDRTERRGRTARDEDARDHGRSASDDDAARTRCDAARLRQGNGRRGGRDLHPRAAKRLADDVQHRRPAVHRRGRERRTPTRASTSRSASRNKRT